MGRGDDTAGISLQGHRDTVPQGSATSDSICICPAQLKPWKLEGGDTALLDLIPMLEQVFRTNVPDVRAVVRSFEGQDIPSAFRERMQRLQQQKTSERRGLFGSLRR